MEVYQFGEADHQSKGEDTGPECCVVRQDLLSYCNQDGLGEINVYLKDDVKDLLFGFVVLNLHDEEFHKLNQTNLYDNIFSIGFKDNGRRIGQARDLYRFQFEFKKNLGGDLLMGVRYRLTTNAFTRGAETLSWSERKVTFSPRILRFAIRAPQRSIRVFSKNDAAKLQLKPFLIDSCRTEYICNICLTPFVRMGVFQCGHSICVACEPQLSNTHLQFRNGNREVKCPLNCKDKFETLFYIRFRDGPCPLEDGCEKPTNKPIALYPCGCVLSHPPPSDLAVCPYEKCQEKVENFIRIYFDEHSNN